MPDRDGVAAEPAAAQSAAKQPAAAQPTRGGEAGGSRDLGNELMLAVQRGERPALNRLFSLYTPKLYSFIVRIVGDPSAAEDIVQETWMALYERRDGYQPTYKFSTWLFTIARRTALNHFRAAKKWEEVPDDTPSESPSPANQSETSDAAENLWAHARRILSQREFEVLWLRFAEELSIEETARIAGLTATHVKVLVYRARQQLMKGAMPS